MLKSLHLQTAGPGLHEFTHQVEAIVEDANVAEGLCTLFVRHTSASLTIQENADPAVCRDLESFLGRLVPRGDPLFTHRSEGPDDMPAHVRSALTATSLGIPIQGGHLALGTWQGIYLWEHRDRPRLREVLVQIQA